MRWMKLEPIIQSELSQKEKHQYSILTHIYGNNNPVYETAKETLMYRTVFWTLWERERVGWKNAIWENGIEMYIIICETNRQSRFDA